MDAHGGQAIHAVSFSPSDTKFVSCGDDSTVRVWDWAERREEKVMEGHGWDVKTVAWHPRSSVICSGSKDNLVKLWDPRSGSSLSTLYGHKNTVTKVAWNDNGVSTVFRKSKLHRIWTRIRLKVKVQHDVEMTHTHIVRIFVGEELVTNWK